MSNWQLFYFRLFVSLIWIELHNVLTYGIEKLFVRIIYRCQKKLKIKGWVFVPCHFVLK